MLTLLKHAYSIRLKSSKHARMSAIICLNTKQAALMRRSIVLILPPSISIPCSVGHSNSFSMEHHQQRKGREMFSQQTHRLSASFQSSPTFWSGNIGFKTYGQTKLWCRDLWSVCHLLNLEFGLITWDQCHKN